MGLFNKSTDKKFDKIFDRYVKKLHSSVKGNNIENLCNNSEELAAELKKAGCSKTGSYVEKYFRERENIISNWYEKAKEELEKKLGEDYMTTPDYDDLFWKWHDIKSKNEHFLDQIKISNHNEYMGHLYDSVRNRTVSAPPRNENLIKEFESIKRKKVYELISQYESCIKAAALSEKFNYCMLSVAQVLKKEFEKALISIDGLTNEEKELYLKQYDAYFCNQWEADIIFESIKSKLDKLDKNMDYGSISEFSNAARSVSNNTYKILIAKVKDYLGISKEEELSAEDMMLFYSMCTAEPNQLNQMLEENKKSENSTTKEVNGKFSK